MNHRTRRYYTNGGAAAIGKHTKCVWRRRGGGGGRQLRVNNLMAKAKERSRGEDGRPNARHARGTARAWSAKLRVSEPNQVGAKLSATISIQCGYAAGLGAFQLL